MKSVIIVRVVGELQLADNQLGTAQAAFDKLTKVKDALVEAGITVTEFQTTTTRRRGEKA